MPRKRGTHGNEKGGQTAPEGPTMTDLDMVGDTIDGPRCSIHQVFFTGDWDIPWVSLQCFPA